MSRKFLSSQHVRDAQKHVKHFNGSVTQTLQKPGNTTYILYCDITLEPMALNLSIVVDLFSR